MKNKDTDMKQLLHILSVFAFTVSLAPSCTLKSEYPADIEIPAYLSLSVGETYDLGQESSSWSSKNDFVAQIETDGVVTAKHVGKCTIMFSNFRQTLRCEVTVFPNTTLYSEPIQQWGISRTHLISMKGEPYSETDNVVGYTTGNDVSPVEIYSFEDGKLNAAAVVVPVIFSDDLANHLAERYQPMYIEGFNVLFLNGNSLDAATTAVYTNTYEVVYIMVMYLDANSAKTESTKSENFTDKLFLDMMKKMKSEL